MIGRNIQVKLNGLLFTAFQIFCAKRGYETGGEAIRDIVRELPEYKELSKENGSVESAHKDDSDNNTKENSTPQSANAG